MIRPAEGRPSCAPSCARRARSVVLAAVDEAAREAAIQRIELIDRRSWEPVAAPSGLNGGVHGWVSKIQALGVVAYVRENFKAPGGSSRGGGRFFMSSGERWGMHTGHYSPGALRAAQVLELAAPPALWDQLAELVALADGMDRPVLPHRQFTIEWATRHFAAPRAEV